MNLILFDRDETERPLPRHDPRARHILNVLRRTPGQTFDVGLVNGPKGKAELVAFTDDVLTLRFTWQDSVPTQERITLIVGLPRPQTARDILRDASTLGASALHFVRTDRGESSYAQSTLWSSGEWARHVRTGVEQAFETHLPEVTHGRSLADVIASLPSDSARIALDNYESPVRLGECQLLVDNVVLAIGSERGWSPAERARLRASGFRFAHLGPRVLRTETACIAALTLVRAQLGLL
ncbi:MAG: 16S rRNA (uracil(1498)-N(3))-methyltransferase [Opitutus sp.]|nr:16S rRNA (uracil(1498)-N(3))-methyltransferase [Opitutus sp.]